MRPRNDSKSDSAARNPPALADVACLGVGATSRSPPVLYWAVIFFIIAIVAGIFGFGGIAAASAGIAKILFFIFLVIFVISLIVGLIRRA